MKPSNLSVVSHRLLMLSLVMMFGVCSFTIGGCRSDDGELLDDDDTRLEDAMIDFDPNEDVDIELGE